MLPILLALPIAAQVGPAQPPATVAPTDEARAIALAGSIGTILYTLDRAAWVATDALRAALPKERFEGGGGYVVERTGDAALVVTFYRGMGDAARAFFAADVVRGKVTPRPIADPVALTPAQARLARARDAATAEAVRLNLRPCTPGAFNTVVMPTGGLDAPVLVYLLSAQPAADTFPFGGHYRMSVRADGTIGGLRPFMRTCMNMTLPKQPGAMPFVSHLLDPVPTEIHVFSSMTMRRPLFVGTGDRVWEVKGRQITLAPVKQPSPPK